MSIVIRGMDMPREGTVMVVCEVNEQPCVVVRGAEPYPLVSVPPHGRLIDANELCEFCNNTIDHSATPNDIMRFPTILEAEGQVMDNPYPICEKCIFMDEPIDKAPCQECTRAFLTQRIKPNFVSKRSPKTNADRIRAMSDDELAYFMVCTACRGGQPTDSRLDSWADWLKQEVGE